MISSSFFAGLESFMEDDTVEASATVTVSPEEQVQEQVEAEEVATEQAEDTAEVEQEAQAAEMIFAKFDEIDRMVAHVETYGVDRSFLSICNHDNILGTSFGIQLPACESFDAVGDPHSIASQEALEGLKDAARKVWEFIKRICARLVMFLKRLIKLVPIRLALIKRKIKKLEEVKESDHSSNSEKNGVYFKPEDFADKINQMKANIEHGVSVSLPKPAPSGQLMGAKFSNGKANLDEAKKVVGEIEGFLKDLPKSMKDISDLNLKVAQAERAGNGEDAQTLKADAKAKQTAVASTHKVISYQITKCSRLLKGAAEIFAATKTKKQEAADAPSAAE